LIILAFLLLRPSAARPDSPVTKLRVNGQRLGLQIERLSEIGRNRGGGVDRPAFSEADIKAREYILTYIRKLGLRVQVDAAGNIIGRKEGTEMTFIPIEPASRSAPTDPRLRVCIARAAENLGLSKLFLPSGAGHDAQNIARLAPIGMIFIPSVGGISHSPKEYSRPEDVERGANVLLQTILGLDQGCLEENQ
jgi:N-carbamoyl-L-amino-acid hydrolase